MAFQLNAYMFCSFVVNYCLRGMFSYTLGIQLLCLICELFSWILYMEALLLTKALYVAHCLKA